MAAEGIRKVNEYVCQEGRSLIITDPSVTIKDIPNGTLQIDKDTGTFKVKTSGSTDWDRLQIQYLLLPKSITNAYYADSSITGQKIGSKTIVTDNIADTAITTDKLINDAITEVKILNNAVTAAKIAVNAVTNTKIADGAVDTLKIKDASITNTKYADNSISTVKLQQSAVATANIADNAVTSVKVANNAIINTKIADGAVNTQKIATGAVVSTSIADLAITATKYADGSINTQKIADGAVNSNKIADGSILGKNIKDFEIATSKFADLSVTGQKIANTTINISKFDLATQNVINNAVRVDNTGYATVNGNLRVNGSVIATGTVSAYATYNPIYKDLAEAYEPGCEGLNPGNIVEVNLIGQVVHARELSDTVVGVVSDSYAQCYGATEEDIKSGKKIAVGLIGQIYVNVAGKVKPGDKIVSIGNGVGTAANGRISTCSTVGKALQGKYTDGIERVLCLVYPS